MCIRGIKGTTLCYVKNITHYYTNYKMCRNEGTKNITLVN